MPSSCYDCPFAKNKKTNDYGSFCECGVLEDYETINLLEHSKRPNCPLVEQESILDKLRAEIAEYGSICVEYKTTGRREDIEQLLTDVLKQAKKQVLDVIDKYRAESEDKE